MRAYRIKAWKADPELEDVDEPHPADGQVVIRVGAAGACHSDLHITKEFDPSMGPPWALPFTLGHENAGWVHELGGGVTGLEIGQPVAVYGAWGCGTCERCRLGMDNYCENPAGAPVAGGGGGLGLDGGMAELLLVPSARHVLPLPEGLDPVSAAPLTDAGLTPYHAVHRSRAKLGPTATALVIGVGGLGHMAVQIIKATSAARVVAVDKRPEALEMALSLGADDALQPGPDTAERVRAGTGGRGADLVLDFVGAEPTMHLAVGAARTMGDVTIVGLGWGSYPFGFYTVPWEVSLQTTYWGSHTELDSVLRLAARDLVRAEVTTFPLEEAAAAYEALESGRVSGRAVVIPNQSA